MGRWFPPSVSSWRRRRSWPPPGTGNLTQKYQVLGNISERGWGVKNQDTCIAGRTSPKESKLRRSAEPPKLSRRLKKSWNCYKTSDERDKYDWTLKVCFRQDCQLAWIKTFYSLLVSLSVHLSRWPPPKESRERAAGKTFKTENKLSSYLPPALATLIQPPEQPYFY